MNIIQNDWLNIFLGELENTQELKIISPFIKDNIVDHLLKNWKGNQIQVITRYNLNDFRSKVSSLSALEKLVKSGVEIKGIKDLHSKAYIFDVKSMIITSANFTNGGFFNNYELGIISNYTDKVNDTLNYFKNLWAIDKDILTVSQINDWKKLIISKPVASQKDNLPDLGKSIIRKVIGDKNHFIKFYGRGNLRDKWDKPTFDEVKATHCHFALTYPNGNGRPRRYKEGDVVYMARMIERGEYAIFGKAIARKHIDNRDTASIEDINHIPWKKEFSIYIRVHSSEFLDTTFRNCPKMGKLMNELGPECFKPTKERFERGDNDASPRSSIKQKPDVQLSEEGAFWVEQHFQQAKMKFNLIKQSQIDNLYQGNPKI